MDIYHSYEKRNLSPVVWNEVPKSFQDLGLGSYSFADQILKIWNFVFILKFWLQLIHYGMTFHSSTIYILQDEGGFCTTWIHNYKSMNLNQCFFRGWIFIRDPNLLTVDDHLRRNKALVKYKYNIVAFIWFGGYHEAGSKNVRIMSLFYRKISGF